MEPVWFSRYANSSASLPVWRSNRPEERIVNAVSEQTTIVSVNTLKIPHIPWLTGSLTLELQCTITEEPRPASLENTPRFMPISIAILTP